MRFEFRKNIPSSMFSGICYSFLLSYIPFTYQTDTETSILYDLNEYELCKKDLNKVKLFIAGLDESIENITPYIYSNEIQSKRRRVEQKYISEEASDAPSSFSNTEEEEQGHYINVNCTRIYRDKPNYNGHTVEPLQESPNESDSDIYSHKIASFFSTTLQIDSSSFISFAESLIESLYQQDNIFGIQKKNNIVYDRIYVTLQENSIKITEANNKSKNNVYNGAYTREDIYRYYTYKHSKYEENETNILKAVYNSFLGDKYTTSKLLLKNRLINETKLYKFSIIVMQPLPKHDNMSPMSLYGKSKKNDADFCYDVNYIDPKNELQQLKKTIYSDTTYKNEIRKIIFDAETGKLKSELWGLMVYMPELLFYLEWRLAILNYINITIEHLYSLQDEVETIKVLVDIYLFKCDKYSKDIKESTIWELVRKLRILVLKNLKLSQCQPVRYSLYKWGIDCAYKFWRGEPEDKSYNFMILVYAFTLKHNFSKKEITGLETHLYENKSEDIAISKLVDIILKNQHFNYDIIFTLTLISDYIALIKGIVMEKDDIIYLTVPYKYNNLVALNDKTSMKIKFGIVDTKYIAVLLFEKIEKLMTMNVQSARE